MPKDHYVAQVYLEEFLDSTTGMLHVHQKSGKYHPAHTDDICREIDGSNNRYFSEPRIVEEYLKIFEPLWPACINALKEKRFDDDIKYTISGYIAFLRSCNPTARRLGQENMEFVLETTRPVMAKGVASGLEAIKDVDNPEELIKALLDPRLKVKVDSDYTVAIGIHNLVASQKVYFRSPWMVAYNDTDNPFVTCDFPATYWYFQNNPMANVHFPVTPNIAIHIMPAPDFISDEDIPADGWGKMERRRIKMLNTLVVKSAEKFVISNQKTSWIPHLVSKYGDWRMESIKERISIPNGACMTFQQRAMGSR